MARFTEERRPYGIPAGAEIKKLTLDMNQPVHRVLRIVAYDEKTTMADIIRGLTDLYLRDADTREKVTQLLAGDLELGDLLPSDAPAAT